MESRQESSLFSHMNVSNLSIFLTRCLLTLSVFDDAVQQQWILGKSLHLRHQQVFELEPSTLGARFTLLTTGTNGEDKEQHEAGKRIQVSVVVVIMMS